MHGLHSAASGGNRPKNTFWASRNYWFFSGYRSALTTHVFGDPPFTFVSGKTEQVDQEQSKMLAANGTHGLLPSEMDMWASNLPPNPDALDSSFRHAVSVGTPIRWLVIECPPRNEMGVSSSRYSIIFVSFARCTASLLISTIGLAACGAVVAFGIRWWRCPRYSSGHCVRCGYSVEGLKIGTCPECGRPTSISTR